jgi:hypothetical protein
MDRPSRQTDEESAAWDLEYEVRAGEVRRACDAMSKRLARKLGLGPGADEVGSSSV